MSAGRRWWRYVAWSGSGACVATFLALAADLVRLHWAQAEIRTSVMAAALAAASELDGTAEGLSRARRAAQETVGRSLIATTVAGVPHAEFGLSPKGPWQSDPAGVSRCWFVRVRAAGAVPLSILSVLKSTSHRAVQAEAIAGPSREGPADAHSGCGDAGAARLVTISFGVARSSITE